MHDSPLTMLRLAQEHTPPTPTSGLLDAEWWDNVDQRAAEHHARVAASNMEVRSYWSTVGQSPREDYHRAYADLYGMQPVTGPGWANGYTTWDRLCFALNHVVNETEGVVERNRRMVVLTSEPHQTVTTVSVPLRTVQACLAATSMALTGHTAAIGPVPEWRIRNGKCDVLKCVTVERPAEVTWVVEETAAEPIWRNPYQLEDGFLILADSPHRQLSKAGVEGLSVLVQADGRMHLVFWDTAHFPHRRLSKRGAMYTANRVGKRPLAVHSFPVATTEEDALQEMRAVAAAMTRTANYRGDLLPWQAAEFQAEDFQPPVNEISGSLEWLQAIVEQRESGAVYRNHGPESDA